jgi:hypothetical protein
MADKKPGNRQRTGNSTSFKPGVSGNPNGRPKQTQEERDALAEIRKLAPRAAEVLEEMLSSDATPAPTRIKAVELILDRTYGKPDMAVKVDDPKSDALKDIREQVARIKAAVSGE